MSKETFEAERELLLLTWRSTFDLGGEHHARTIRDGGTVDYIATIMERADRTGELTVATVARVVGLLVQGHPFVDCNHRTAGAYLLALMDRLGKRPTVSDRELAAFLRRIDTRGLRPREVEAWIYSAFTG